MLSLVKNAYQLTKLRKNCKNNSEKLIQNRLKMQKVELNFCNTSLKLIKACTK